MRTKNERGSTLIIAMLMLLIMLGLAASMTFTAQSQANMTSGVKLQQFYETASLSAFNRARSVLSDHWQDVDPVQETTEDKNWRFGSLLHAAANDADLSDGNFPEHELLTNVIEMNSGMLELTYKIWVRNNPDDPAVLYQGYDLSNDGSMVLDKNWDLDGKIVLTVEVFAPNDPNVPVVTQSALLGPVGGESVNIHDDSVLEGDESDVGGQGTGTKGTASRITIDELDVPET